MQVPVKDYPQLQFLCWNRPDGTVLDGADALSIYERNWRFVEEDKFEPEEKALLDRLVAEYGNGVLNV